MKREEYLIWLEEQFEKLKKQVKKN